jgi:hypothetical protein
VDAKLIFKRMTLAGLTALTAVAMVAPAGVAAKDGAIIRSGACTNRSDWKLKLSPDNGRIEVEFEVDTPRAGQTWRVKMFQNDTRFFLGTRTTVAPSDSFSVRFLRPNTTGTDVFRGRAVNLTTGEVCVGRASI